MAKSLEQMAFEEYQKAIEDYTSQGPEGLRWLEDFQAEELGDVGELGSSGLADITTDPRFAEYEMEALRQLEEQAQSGLTAGDRADLAQIEAQTNRNIRGQRGAIQNQMASRGLSGSGLDYFAQEAAGQDDIERQALMGLEKAGMMQDRKQSAAARLGSLGSEMSQREYQRKAEAARAQDEINRFNLSSRMDRERYNNDLRNRAGMVNLEGRQGIANQNVENRNRFAADSMNAKAGLAQNKYNYAVEMDNRRRIEDENNRRRREQRIGALTGVAGAAIGSKAGPAGATAGYQVGSGLGQAIASDESGKENLQKEDDFNIDVFLKSIEPKSFNYKGDATPKHGVVAQDLSRSKIGNDMLRQGENGLEIDVNDAVSALLQAVAYLDKKVEKNGSNGL